MASSAPLKNLHGNWRLFLFKSLEGNALCWNQSRVVFTLFCSCPLSLWKTRLFSTATSEMPIVLWLCQGIKVGSCFSAGAICSNPVTRGECPFNCAVTFPSLLGSSSALQRHPCLVFLCPALNCSWHVLCLLDDKLIKNIGNMAVC